MAGLATTQICAITLSSANAVAEGDTGASAPLVFLFRGNPDNYTDTNIQSASPVALATQAQLKANLGVITGVTNLLQSGAFKRLTIDGVVGTKRAQRQIIVPMVAVSLLIETIEQQFAGGTPVKIGTGTNAMDAHGASVGLKRTSR